MVIPPCSICDGSGRVYSYAARESVFCICWANRTSLLARDVAGIRRDYWDATFESFEPRQEYPNQQAVLNFAKAYAADWETVKSEGRCLTILGAKSSMGKSHLAVAICLDIMGRYWTQSTIDQDVCLFVNVASWFLDWRLFLEKFPSPPKGSPLWDGYLSNPAYIAEKSQLGKRDDRMLTTELLVLDDLSRFEVNEKRLERLYHVVDRRISNGLPIIVTDNNSTWAQVSRKLGDDYGPPITDRFIRSGETVIVELPMSKKGRKKSVSKTDLDGQAPGK